MATIDYQTVNFHFRVDFNFEGEKQVLITNALGEVILKSTTNQAYEKFDLSGFKKGMYFILKANEYQQTIHIFFITKYIIALFFEFEG